VDEPDGGDAGGCSNRCDRDRRFATHFAAETQSLIVDQARCRCSRQWPANSSFFR
jgi:hypothetical protein